MTDHNTQGGSRLDPNAILIAEFEYIARTAFQANEDRARVSNYYLVTTAAAVAAILGAKLESAMPAGVYWGFAAVFGVLSVVGLLTILQLARLRSAWTESARAMNRIKDHYRIHCPEAQLDQAFAWTTASIPPANKRKSVAFLLALSVVVVDAVTAAVSIVYIGLALGSKPDHPILMIVGGLLGMAFAVLQYLWYLRWVEEKNK